MANRKCIVCLREIEQSIDVYCSDECYWARTIYELNVIEYRSRRKLLRKQVEKEKASNVNKDEN